MLSLYACTVVNSSEKEGMIVYESEFGGGDAKFGKTGVEVAMSREESKSSKA